MRYAVLAGLAWQSAKQPLPAGKSRKTLLGAGVLALASEYEIRHNTARAIKTHKFHAHFREKREQARKNARKAGQAATSTAGQAKQRVQRIDWKAWQKSREGRIVQGAVGLLAVLLLAARLSGGSGEDAGDDSVWGTAVRTADSVADTLYSGARRAAGATSSKTRELGSHLKPHADKLGSQAGSAATEASSKAQEFGSAVKPKADKLGSQITGKAQEVSDAVQPRAREWSSYVSSAAQGVSGAVVPQAKSFGSQVGSKAQEVSDIVGPQVQQLGSQIGDGAQQLADQLLPSQQRAAARPPHVSDLGISKPDSVVLSSALARPTMLLLAAVACDASLRGRGVLAHVAPEQRKRAQVHVAQQARQVHGRVQQVQLPQPIVVTGVHVRHAMEGLWQRVRSAVAWVPARAPLSCSVARKVVTWNLCLAFDCEGVSA